MPKRVRPSAIAGTWYPGSHDALEQAIRSFLDAVPAPDVPDSLFGLIVPHAAYAFSGPVAARAYRCLQDKPFDTAVVLSPMHRMPFSSYHVTDADYYETPLGRIPVNRSLLEEVTAALDCTEIPNDQEHSLEIQLPFLQVVLKSFDLVPIMIGHSRVYDVSDLVESLHSIYTDRKVVTIASSDLHHIPDYRAVLKADKRVLDALSKFNLNEIRQVLSRRDSSVCGRAAISAMIELALKSDASRLDVLDHCTSGDVTGKTEPGEYTVGYTAAVVS